MLETEIKKLTAALEANTAALLGGASAIPTNTKAAAPVPVTPTPAPAPQTPPPVTPGLATATTPPVVPPQVTAAPQPAPVAVAQVAPAPQAMTHVQAQAELTAIVQQLGDGTAVQQIMLQYGSAQLNQIPVENLFSLVQACRALIPA